MKQSSWQKAVLLSSTLILQASLALAASPPISVNFQGRDGSSTATTTPPTPPVSGSAGVIPTAIWNDVDDSNTALFPTAENGTTPALYDDASTLTAVTLTFDCNDSWYNDVSPTNITSPNAMLMNGIIKVSTGKKVGAFVFNNVPEGTYDMYVYCDMNGDGVQMKVSDLQKQSPTYYVIEQHQFYDTNTFVQGTNTDPNNTNAVCNYVKLSGLGTHGTGRIGAITEWMKNADGIGIAAVQLVNTGAATPNTTPVAVTSQPFNRRVLVGDTNVTLTIAATGPIQGIQWYTNGVAAAGASDISYQGISTNGFLYNYTLPAIVAGFDGMQVTAVVSNNVNTATSSPGVITVGKIVSVPGIDEKLWFGATRAAVEAGTYDSTNPAVHIALGVFEAPQGQGNNYAERLSAIFIAPATTNYTFFVTSDDDSDLFVSTDATPLNKTLVAQELDWANPLDWVSNDAGNGNHQVTQKRSDSWVPDPANPPATPPFASGISMTAGKQYYIEAVHHQGGGGDNASVTFKFIGESDPANGDHSRITAFNVAPYAQGLDGAYIVVTNPPSNISATQTLTATFSGSATSGYQGDNSGLAPSIAYQWQVAAPGSSTFVNIPGANSTSYTTPLLFLTNSGTQYRLTMIAGDATTNSAAATLTVLPDTIPPRPVTVTKVFANGLQMVLTFSELLDQASAQTAADYVINGSITATNASLDSTGTTVTLLFGAPIPTTVTNVLAITGVKDFAGNPVVANTTISFSYTTVTYQADIEFDGPIAYFRFEEPTTSSVATNSGSSGVNGAYYLGDETTAGAGGVSTNASGAPGPRPPTFAGFAADNHSALFTGSTANGGNQEWIDAKAQYLQGVSAFTLEYWVNPIRTNTAYANGVDWGTRIGLVGQNNAVEYGFIDPATIQIWTPNGGSLNTTYPYPDSEWHHIATIGDGTTLKNYFDGKLIGTGGSAIGATGGYGSSPYNVHIGGSVFDGTGNYFIGNMDEVAIFDKAIPAARVAEHYSAGKNGGVLVISGAVTPVISQSATVTITKSGATVSISWSPAGGTLQSTTALGTGAVWTDVGTANPATVNPTSSATFYRVKN